MAGASKKVGGEAEQESGGLKEFFRSREPGEAKSGVSRPGASKPVALYGEVSQIDLALLDDNPYQARRAMDEEKLEQLAASIAEHGLLEAIVVRRAGDRFQVIAGHRRTAAMKLLHQRAQEQAQSDTERQKYACIPAQQKPDVDELQMEEFGLVENIHREDLSPVELAAGVAAFQQRMNLPAHEMAARLKESHDRIKRLLRLNAAPDVIKEGVTGGVLVPVLDDAGRPAMNAAGRSRNERRKLDFVAADELCRLYHHWLKEAGGVEKKATSRIQALVQRALTEAWGFRRVQRFCRDAMSPKGVEHEGAGQPQQPALFALDEAKLVVHLRHVAKASEEHKAALRSALHSVLAQVSP